MNEFDIVVDVRQSPDTSELIILKQKVAFSGETSLVGGPVESRVGLTAARVSGDTIRPVLDRFGVEISRRAAPLFDTLPEADRVAVIAAAATR